MADRLRSDRPVVLTQPVPDWQLPAPYADVEVASDEMANWVLSRKRKAVLRPRCPNLLEYVPSPSRVLLELVNWRKASKTPTHTSTPSHRCEQEEGPSVIDLGCGAGRDASWLLSYGWRVLGVDRLPPQAEIPFVQANLHEFQSDQLYNLVLLHYCWDPGYLRLALSLVDPGGRLSLLGHSETHFRCFGHPRPSKVLRPEQVTQAIYPGLDIARKTPWLERSSGFRVIQNEEFWSLDRHSVWMVLERHK